MSKGIVIEIKGQSILIMTPDGQFKQIAKQERSCQLGEEISYVDTIRKPLYKWRSSRPFAIAAASVFCIMIVALLSMFGDGLSTNKVAAYVTMDINPSIEVGIDKDENVLEIRGINGDGEELIKDIDYKGVSLDAFSDLIIQRIEHGHYLDQGQTNIIIASTVVNNDKKDYEVELAEKVKTKFIAAINKTHDSVEEEIIVTAITAPKEVRKEAINQGVSTGKKAVQLLTQNQNNFTTDEDLKEKPIQQMIKENGGIDQIFPKDHKVTKEDFKSLLKVQQDKKNNRKKERESKENGKKDNSKNEDNKNNENVKNDNKKDENKKDENKIDENKKNDNTFDRDIRDREGNNQNWYEGTRNSNQDNQNKDDRVNQKEKDQKEKDQKEKDQKEKDQKEKDRKEKDQKEKAQKEKDQKKNNRNNQKYQDGRNNR